MPKYRKKPIVVDAYQVVEPEKLLMNIDKIPDWLRQEIEKGNLGNIYLLVSRHVGDKYAKVTVNVVTLEGTMKVSPGDYIIKGVNGEFYPCKPDIFEKSYDPVDEPKED